MGRAWGCRPSILLAAVVSVIVISVGRDRLGVPVSMLVALQGVAVREFVAAVGVAVPEGVPMSVTVVAVSVPMPEGVPMSVTVAAVSVPMPMSVAAHGVALEGGEPGA